MYISGTQIHGAFKFGVIITAVKTIPQKHTVSGATAPSALNILDGAKLNFC